MPCIRVLKGDITRQQVDAVVNAANSSLMGGGGVDGAIHRAGGPAILEACRQIIARIGHLPTGEAVVTTAGRLPARHVIHTVGPVYEPERPEEMQRLLARAYWRSLEEAVAHGLRTVAFPNISTGVYGYPKRQAATVAIATVRAFLEAHPDAIDEVRFVCFDDENYRLYREMLGREEVPI